MCCPRTSPHAIITVFRLCAGKGTEAAALWGGGGGTDEVSEDDVQLLILDVWGPVGEEVKHRATDVAARVDGTALEAELCPGMGVPGPCGGQG